MVELFPPGALVVGRGADCPIGRKRVSFEPMEYVKGDNGVCDIDECPCLKVVESREETDEESDSGYNTEIKSPCGGRIEPFDANIIRLGPVAGLHVKREGEGGWRGREDEGERGK